MLFLIYLIFSALLYYFCCMHYIRIANLYLNNNQFLTFLLDYLLILIQYIVIIQSYVTYSTNNNSSLMFYEK